MPKHYGSIHGFRRESGRWHALLRLLNARPVRIYVESDDDGLHVTARVDDYEKTRSTLGIAKFNFAAAVGERVGMG